MRPYPQAIRIKKSTGSVAATAALTLAVILSSSTALAGKWRDEARQEAQDHDHSEYAEYKRPDKNQFLDDLEKNAGLHDTTTLKIRPKFRSDLIVIFP